MLFGLAAFLCLYWAACSDKPGSGKADKNSRHLNIPDKGIESLMEANTSKIIEGNAGSVIITVGEVTRKEADISIKRNDRIIDERLMREHETMNFEYEGSQYSVELKNIKKPVIGSGKAELSIRQD